MGPGGRTVIMGNYAALNQTRKVIQFIPDSFFGTVDLSKYTVPYSTDTLSKSELEDLVRIT